jgi:hypothetical protein
MNVALLAALTLAAGNGHSSEPGPIMPRKPDFPILQTGPESPLRSLIERYESDRGAISRFYNVGYSKNRAARLKKLYEGYRKDLDSVRFDGLPVDGKVDWILFDNHLRYSTRKLELDEKDRKEAEPLLPFADTVVELAEKRQRMDPIEGRGAAIALDRIHDGIRDQIKALEKDLAAKLPKVPAKPVVFRAANLTDGFRGLLKEWYEFFKGYDPVFTWWAAEPYKKADLALVDYGKFLKEKAIGLKPDDKDAIVGDPIGEEALVEALNFELIPYKPQELVEIAEKEYTWCLAEAKKAAKEMGFGDDWKKALEKVKNLHVEPGEQPKLIREQALEAIEYVEKNDLVTVPDLAKEIWRMDMMSPERQKVSPFFLGGEAIIVSFPTDSMGHDEKLMSLRANNIHFARATVHHELIPGHHLQGFMNQRNKPYRRTFGTPFWTEGWALWFEFLLWDLGFPKSPENRMGMLFWRMHRCVRIIFSLGFHLKKLTPEECVKMLVERVGHEPSTAEGEVRRSFGGQYSPLYQAAYMLGALQFRALAKELVDSKKMTYRQFHDAILKENNMPVAMLRAKLKEEGLAKNFDPKWRFYGN